MRHLSIVLTIMLLLLGLVNLSSSFQRGPAVKTPPLDPTLMAWKEQGAWYFLCEAPIYQHRIPPHYLTFGPPPPCCPPPMCPPGTPYSPPAKVR